MVLFGSESVGYVTHAVSLFSINEAGYMTFGKIDEMEQNARLMSSLSHFNIHLSSCVIALPSLTVCFLCSFPTGHETSAHGAGSGGSVLLPQTSAVHGLRRPLEARPKTITDS